VDSHEFGEAIKGSAPVVLINSRGSKRGSVVLDDAAGARLATEHLLTLGHRDIALIGGDVHSYTARARERGYVKAINAVGMRRRTGWILRHGYGREAGRQSIHELCVRASRRPTGVVVSNVNAALGVLLGAREVGLAVPDQLSVIAIHDTWVADVTWPPLTTVRMPMYQLGQEAVRALNLLLSGGRAVDSVVDNPAPVLTKRASTAPPPRRAVRGRIARELGSSKGA
jgi:LacI family transcriptional regulator